MEETILMNTPQLNTSSNFAGAPWEQRYAELVEFRAQHGNCRVPHSYFENIQLGRWVGTQRASKDVLSEERKSKLDAIGFDWNPKESIWNEHYEELINFQQKHGHSRVPQRTLEYKTLGGWTRTQRFLRDTMSEERKSKLDAIDFDWNPCENSWSKHYEELVEFKLQHGHCKVPYEYPSNQKLSDWVRHQRPLKKSMSKKRRSMFDALGFYWNPVENVWDERYKELVAFKNTHHHCRATPKNCRNKQLLNWIHNQRILKNTIGKEKKEKLDALGFDWEPFENKWNERYDELVQFKLDNGHCRVIQHHPQYSQLASWVSTQRKSKKRLSEEKIEKLNQLGFDWDMREIAWNEKYQELIEFKLKNGHFSVPTNKQLGQWVYKQKKSKEKLSEERTKKLNEIGFFEK